MCNVEAKTPKGEVANPGVPIISEKTTHLPGPEEWIHKSIHTGQGEILETRLDGVIPCSRVVPHRSAVRVQRGCLRSLKPEPTVIGRNAELSGNVDTKRCLTKWWVGVSDCARRYRGFKVNADIPREHPGSPAGTRLLWPNTSIVSVWSDVRNWRGVGTSVKGEVRVRVQDDSVRVGKVASPNIECSESVSN